MKFILLIISLLAFSFFGNSQTDFRGYPDITRDGAIIFYLKSDSMRVALLRKNGDTAIANKLEKNALELNQRIITSFRKDFKFCPIYFISSNYVDGFRHGEKLNNFYNDQMEIDPSIVVKEKNLVYASLDHDYEMGKNGYPLSVTSIDMIAIKDKNLVPLSWPFPYYTQVSSDVFLIPKKIESYPRLLQNNLEIFYYYPSKRIVRILKKQGKWEEIRR